MELIERITSLEKRANQIAGDGKLVKDAKKLQVIKEKSDIEKKITNARSRVSQLRDELKKGTIVKNKAVKEYMASGKSLKESAELVIISAIEFLALLIDEKNRSKDKQAFEPYDNTIVVDTDLLQMIFTLNITPKNWGVADSIRPIAILSKIDLDTNPDPNKYVYNYNFKDSTKVNPILKETTTKVKNTLLSIYTKIEEYYNSVELKYYKLKDFSNFDLSKVVSHKEDLIASLMGEFDLDELLSDTNWKEIENKDSEEETKKEEEPKETKKDVKVSFDDLDL